MGNTFLGLCSLSSAASPYFSQRHWKKLPVMV